MKKTFIALALAAMTGSALACPNCGPSAGSITSQAVAGVSSASYANINSTGAQVSAHGAYANAQNTTCVTGDAFAAPFVGAATSGAVTSGSTFTAAGGFGAGGASAGAGQYGYGEITVGASQSGYFGGNVSSTSGVMTDTGSSVNVVNSGLGVSGSMGDALNASSAGYTNLGCGTKCSSTKATSIGGEVTKAWGFGEGVAAGGVSSQWGNASAKAKNGSSSYAD